MAGAFGLKSFLRGILRATRTGAFRSREERAEDLAFRAYVAVTIDTHEYLKAYPDVRNAGIDPAEHWLRYGLYEGRMLAPAVAVQRGAAPSHWRPENIARFTWQGEVVLISEPLPKAIAAQINAQARHEPALLAPGVTALSHLRWHDASDLFTRDGVDAGALFDAVAERPRIVLVIPEPDDHGAMRYGRDLIDAVVTRGGAPVLVVVTDQSERGAGETRKQAIPASFPDAPVVHWHDTYRGSNRDAPRVLASFINVLRPKTVVVVNSRLGLDMVAVHGRGLSHQMSLCCAYVGAGGIFGDRFPRLTMPYALTLTDDAPAAEALRIRFDGIGGPGIAVLPRSVQPASDSAFDARLESRRRRIAMNARPLVWACCVKVETFEGMAILVALAGLRPEDRFEVFSVERDARDALLINIVDRGVPADIAYADFSGHDGFISIGLFEETPNIVLEMSQHAIPLVLIDTGRSRDELDDGAAVFVPPAATAAATAAALVSALDIVAELTADQAAVMARAARTQVMARHAPSVHARNVARLFNLP